MSRLRKTAGWVPAVVLVPAVLAAAVGAARIDDPTEAMAAMQPLEPGTTWVYAVGDHGEPSGRRTRQVLGPSQLVTDGEVVDLVRISSVYDNRPGTGPESFDAYVGIDGDELLQYALLGFGQTFDIVPPAPAYVLPPEVGTTWEYDGTVADGPYEFDAEVVDTGDVEVGGRTFEDCAEIVNTIVVQDGEKGEVDLLTEWTCPDIGVVRSHLVNEVQDVDVTEELVRFRSPGLALDLGPLPDPVLPTDGGPAEVDRDAAPSTAGFDPARSHAVSDGRLGRELAWTEVRGIGSSLPAVSDGRTVVLGEKDGLVSGRDEVTGELRWQVGLAPPIVATPAIHDDVVLVADASKALWALSLEDGTAQWVHTFDDVVGATPTVAGGVVAVPVEDATVVALDPDDGDVEWTATLAGRAINPPAARDDLLVVGDSSGALTALDLADGAQVWSNDLSNGVDLGPAIGGDIVVASDMDGVLGAYDLEDGTLLWQKRGRSYSTEPFAVTDDEVVMVSEGNAIESFQLRDGARRWERDLSDLDVAPVIVGDEVLTMSSDGRATVLGLDDGEVVDTWRVPRPDGARVEMDRPVARTDDAVVYQAAVTTLSTSYVYYAYPTTADARPRGVSYAAQSYPMPQIPHAPPVLDGDTIYALSSDKVVLRSALPADVAPLTIIDGITVGLAVGQGVLVVPSGEQTLGLDATTGEQLWSLPSGEGSLGSTPAVDEDTAFVPLPEVGLAAADLRTGQTRWVVPVDGAGKSAPLPTQGGDVLYAASGLARYDGRTGEALWQLGGDLGDAVAYTPLAADQDTVYALLVVTDLTMPNGERVELVAADLRTGRVRWQEQVAGLKFLVGPAVGSGVVVSTDSANVVTARDTRTGEELWSYRMATQPTGAPVVSDGVVHVVEGGRVEDLAARNFRIVTLDAATGRFLGAYEPPGVNDVLVPTIGSGPEGELLIPTVDLFGVVQRLEATR